MDEKQEFKVEKIMGSRRKENGIEYFVARKGNIAKDRTRRPFSGLGGYHELHMDFPRAHLKSARPSWSLKSHISRPRCALA